MLTRAHVRARLTRSHPPLGKLVFVLVSTFVRYDYKKVRRRRLGEYAAAVRSLVRGGRPSCAPPSLQCGFANISDDFGPECKYLWFR